MFTFLKLKERNKILVHELGSNWPVNKGWELGLAHGNVLLNLDNTQRIISALCLDRKYIMDTPLIPADVNLVCLNLAKVWHGCAQVPLKRVTSHTGQKCSARLLNDLCKRT